MKLYITVDVETYSGDYDLDVWGHGLGLPFLVDVFEKYNVKATFFVEALGATRWGSEHVRKIFRYLSDAGHDIQLHLHPVVADISGFEDHYDTIWRQDLAVQTGLIEKGLEIMKQCGCNAITVFRAGALAANRDTLRAMTANNLFISSNRDMDVKSSIESKINDVFPVINDLSFAEGVIDLPVSVFRSPFPMMDGKYRHLEICAVGSKEMQYVLSRMKRAGYLSAAILTHPQEYFKRRNKTAKKNSKNCRRIENLLKWVRNDSGIEIDVAGNIRKDAVTRRDSPPEIYGSPLYSIGRMLSQAVGRYL